MKKIMALLVAGVLTCSVGMTALASPSPSTPSTETPVTSTTSTTVKGSSSVAEIKVWDKILVNGEEVSSSVSITEAADEVVRAAEVQAAAVVGSNAVILNVVDVNFSESFKSITIPFNLKNVKANDKIVVLHQKADGTWETITPDKVEDGKVTATFTSLSPVAFVTGGSAAAVKSPKTGDIAVPFVAILAVVSLAGSALVGKKSLNK